MFTFGKTFRSWMNEESRKLLAVDYDQISELYLRIQSWLSRVWKNLKGLQEFSD